MVMTDAHNETGLEFGPSGWDNETGVCQACVHIRNIYEMRKRANNKPNKILCKVALTANACIRIQPNSYQFAKIVGNLTHTRRHFLQID